MADWTPKVGDLAVVVDPANDMSGWPGAVVGDVVQITAINQSGTLQIFCLRLGYGDTTGWKQERFKPIDQPQTQKDT